MKRAAELLLVVGLVMVGLVALSRLAPAPVSAAGKPVPNSPVAFHRIAAIIAAAVSSRYPRASQGHFPERNPRTP